MYLVMRLDIRRHALGALLRGGRQEAPRYAAFGNNCFRYFPHLLFLSWGNFMAWMETGLVGCMELRRSNTWFCFQSS